MPALRRSRRISPTLDGSPLLALSPPRRKRKTKKEVATPCPALIAPSTASNAPPSSRKRVAEDDEESAEQQQPAQPMKSASPEPVVEEEEEEEVSMLAMRWATAIKRSTPPPPVQPAYIAYIERRKRERELEEQQQQWLGEALTSPGENVVAIAVSKEENATQNVQSDQEDSQSEAGSIPEPSEAQTSEHQQFNALALALTPIQEETEPPKTPGTSGWGLRKILAPVSRLFGLTPRTEPVRGLATPLTAPARRLARPSADGISPPTSTPSKTDNSAHVETPSTTKSTQPSHSMPQTPIDRRQSAESAAGRIRLPSPVEEPITPTANTGITTLSFLPQSAPQPRNSRQPSSRPSRRSMSVAQRLALYDANVAKRDAAEEEARQKAIRAEQRRRQLADEAEDYRLRAEALELRKIDITSLQKTGEKRKVRIDDLDVIPNPVQNGYGLDERFFDDDSDAEVEINDPTRVSASDVSMLDNFTPPPAKKVRFNADSPSALSSPRPANERSAQKKTWSQIETFNDVSPYKTTPAAPLSADPHCARPYTGTMFADTHNDATFDGANVFEQSQNRDAKKILEDSQLSPISYGRKYHVWIAPKSPPKERPADFNWEGHFQVPEDSDSESDYDESDSPASPTPAQKVTTERSTTALGDVGMKIGVTESFQPRTNLFMQQSEQEKAAITNADFKNAEPAFTQQPPPPPTPAHAALPSTSATAAAAAAASSQSDSDALAKARLQAEKYKPKTPSGLRATSRLSSSPVVATSLNNDKSISNYNAAITGQTQPAQTSAVTVGPGQTTHQIPDAGATSAGEKHAVFEELPYEKTTQYAIELATAVSVDQIPCSDFVWPSPTPAPWAHLIDTEVQVALDTAEQHPDWLAYCDQRWATAWNKYQEEKAAGMHDGLLLSAPKTAQTA